jgi:hypothetical protein
MYLNPDHERIEHAEIVGNNVAVIAVVAVVAEIVAVVAEII